MSRHEEDAKIKKQKEIFAKNLSNYLYNSGMKQVDLAKLLGVPQTTVNTWVRGASLPYSATIQKIASIFNVQASDLLDDHTNQSIDEQYAEIAYKIGMSDERFQRLVIDYYHQSAESKEEFCNFYEKFIAKKKSRD